MPVIRRAYQRLVDTNDRAYLTITIAEHKHGTSRLHGAMADIERELGRVAFS